MRITYVVPRYGPHVAGGAEQVTRQYAERLARRGHNVAVITSTSESYLDWSPSQECGVSIENDVEVHRLDAIGHDQRAFSALNARTVAMVPGERAVALEREWARGVGPRLRGLGAALTEVAGQSDVVVVGPYMFRTTAMTVRTLCGWVPLVLHPAAHDEPALRLAGTRETLRRADAFGFFTPEERGLTELVVGRVLAGEVVGVGFDTSPDCSAPIHDRDDRFLLCLGRTDPGKGVHDLVRYVETFRRRRRELPVRLVVAGAGVGSVPAADGVTFLGWVDDAERAELLRRCVAVVQPSYFESFAMVLAEAWLHGRPALVNRTTPVLTGQVRRAGGGIGYDGYREFEAAMVTLLTRPDVADELGDRGRRYVTTNWTWPAVMERYERLLQQAIDVHRRRWA